MDNRIQLTLFVDRSESVQLEEIRKKYNPLQYKIINSHVTLCREDELQDTSEVIKILNHLNYPSFILQFGKPIRFASDKGLLLPVVGGKENFYALRNEILQKKMHTNNLPEPHLTLMHPRNSTCSDEVFEEISEMELPTSLIFRSVSLIKQENESEWKVLNEFPLEN